MQKINNNVHGEKQYTKQYKNTEHTRTKQKAQHTKQENKHKINNEKYKTINQNITKCERHKANSNKATRKQGDIYCAATHVKNYINISP